MSHARGRTAELTVLSRMPQQTRDQITGIILAGAGPQESAYIAGDEAAPAEVLARLSSHPRAYVRAAVGANPNVSDDILRTLETDTAKTVAAAAKRTRALRQLTALAAAKDGTISRDDTTSAAMCDAMAHENSWPETGIVDTAVTLLLADSAWREDPQFLAASLAHHPRAAIEGLSQAVGWSASFRLIVQAADGDWLWDALHWFFSETPGIDTDFTVLNDNTDVVSGLLAAELGEDWPTRRRKSTMSVREEASYFMRAALSETSLEALQRSTTDGDRAEAVMAAVNGRQREDYRQWLRSTLNLDDVEDDLFWLLADGLDDNDILDLPYETLHRIPYSQLDTWLKRGEAWEELLSMDRVIRIFAQRLAEITGDNVETWRTYQALADDYTGSMRDILTATKAL